MKLGTEEKNSEPELNLGELFNSALEYLRSFALPSLYTLLECADLVCTEEIPTAALAKSPTGTGLALLVNPTFIKTYANTPLSFTGILLHELFHGIFKHLDILEKETNKHKQYLWNVAMDAIINSLIYDLATLKRKNLTKSFSLLYELDSYEALLRPPNLVRRLRNKEQSKILPLDLRNFYNRLYHQNDITETDVFNWLLANLPKQEDMPQCILVGNHTEKKSDKDKPILSKEEAEQVLDEIAEDLGNQLYSFGTYSLSAKLRRLRTTFKKTHSDKLALAVERALLNSAKSKLVSKLATASKSNRSVIIPPQLNATDLLKLSGGLYPMFFVKKRLDGKPVECSVYIDVSGSVQEYVDWIYGCITDITRIAEIKPYLFSTVVNPVTMQDIHDGKIITTGGTCFNCIADHALNANVSKAVIFTDGEATMGAANVKKIKEKNIMFIAAVFSLYNTYQTAAVEKFCASTIKVPKLK